MLTKKLLAAVGIAGALLLGASTDASARPFRGPYFRPGPVYRTPVFVPAPRVVVYPAPVYGPVYYPVRFRHHPHHWVRPYGYRW